MGMDGSCPHRATGAIVADTSAKAGRMHKNHFDAVARSLSGPQAPHPWSRSGPRPRPHSTSNWPIAVPISHDSYQLARSDSLGSTPFFQVLAGLLGKTAKSEARRPLASGDNYLNSASPVSSSSRNLDIYIVSKGDKVSNKAINRITC